MLGIQCIGHGKWLYWGGIASVHLHGVVPVIKYIWPAHEMFLEIAKTASDNYQLLEKTTFVNLIGFSEWNCTLNFNCTRLNYNDYQVWFDEFPWCVVFYSIQHIIVPSDVTYKMLHTSDFGMHIAFIKGKEPRLRRRATFHYCQGVSPKT